MLDKIIIIGSSGHAKVVIDLIEVLGRYSILGLIDDFREKNKDETLGYNVLGGLNDLDSLVSNHQVKNCFIAIGDNQARHDVYIKLSKFNFNYPALIHPKAVLSDKVTVGAGSILMPGAILNCDSQVDQQCIINTGAVVEHDVKIGKFSSLGPKAVLAGKAQIGEFTAIGLSASVIEKVVIGDHCVIGASSLVRDDIENNSVCYGIPAKVIRKRKDHDKYLR